MTMTSDNSAATEARDVEAPPDSSGSSTRRRAWLAIGVLFAVASLLWGTFNVINVLAHEDSVQTSTYGSAEVNRLDIRSNNGSVTVVAGPGDSIEVRTEISEGLGTTKTTERIASGVLELSGECPRFESIWCSVDYVLEIPADLDVTIDVDNGSVLVRGVMGDVDVDNDNGRIELDDVGGNITATNDNGRIVGTALTSSVVRAENGNGRIELTFAAPPVSVRATNGNGSIDVAVPDADVIYRVDIRSSLGQTENRVRTDPASDRTIDLSTENGSITVRPAG